MMQVINNRYILEADHSVYVAMSGGVDSSMAAALLKKKVDPFYAN
jgi:tRNA(Ile)-lysidine synthase TilS/MesJ